MAYNRELLERLRQWARHDQGKPGQIRLSMANWATRDGEGRITAACLGGWAVHQSGAVFLWGPFKGREVALYCDTGRAQTPVSQAAEEVLGISEEEAYILFDLNEEDEYGDRALDFLDFLCDRAGNGDPNLDDEGVDSWVNEWDRAV